MDLWGYINIFGTYIPPSSETYLKGLHKRKEMVLLVGLYGNPVRNGRLSKITSKISNLDRLPFWTGLMWTPKN